jgi:flavin-dependent thymidylate synthase
MKVTLINSTRNAVDVLLFTKQTRLKMSPDLMEEVANWSATKKMAELEYMANTIPSSWEFVDFTFLIEDVTRAFTHQFVRSREASYAQQTMRVLNKDGWTYHTGPTVLADKDAQELYDRTMARIASAYTELLKMGVAIEDARGVLPTNIHTNIVAKFNLRRLAELVAKRSSPRTQDEYRDVLEAMKQAVIAKHPWSSLFLDGQKVQAAAKLDKFIKHSGVEEEIDLIKAVDVLRK